MTGDHTSHCSKCGSTLIEGEDVCVRCAANSLFGEEDPEELIPEAESKMEVVSTPLPGYKIGELIARGGMGAGLLC